MIDRMTDCFHPRNTAFRCITLPIKNEPAELLVCSHNLLRYSVLLICGEVLLN